MTVLSIEAAKERLLFRVQNNMRPKTLLFITRTRIGDAILPVRNFA